MENLNNYINETLFKGTINKAEIRYVCDLPQEVFKHKLNNELVNKYFKKFDITGVEWKNSTGAEWAKCITDGTLKKDYLSAYIIYNSSNIIYLDKKYQDNEEFIEEIKSCFSKHKYMFKSILFDDFNTIGFKDNYNDTFTRKDKDLWKDILTIVKKYCK